MTAPFDHVLLFVLKLAESSEDVRAKIGQVWAALFCFSRFVRAHTSSSLRYRYSPSMHALRCRFVRAVVLAFRDQYGRLPSDAADDQKQVTPVPVLFGHF